MLDKQEDMSKYERGKIYKIVDNTNNNIYIGSTTKTLKVRLNEHKSGEYCVSREIIKNDDYDILLIENYPCDSRKQLEAREGFYIRNNDCININIPGRTDKEYYQDNKDIIKEQSKLWYQDNKEKTLKYKKKYRENNREKNKLYSKNRNAYIQSWGGAMTSNNCNLLKIDVGLFNQ